MGLVLPEVRERTKLTHWGEEDRPWAFRRIPRRKIREILRLRALGYSVHDISRSCGVAASTVSVCLRRAAAAGLTWPLSPDLDETALEQRLYRRPALPPAAHRPQPDWAHVDQELRQKGVTLLPRWDA